MGCGNSSLVQDFDDDKNPSVENSKRKSKKTGSIKEHIDGLKESDKDISLSMARFDIHDIRGFCTNLSLA